MTSESDFDAGQSFCGNCGAAVERGSRVCRACGQPVAGPPAQDAAPPRDYIPYCRSCGVGVAWGTGHTCRRCGVTPLCALHFRAADGLCLDCADAPAYAASAPAAGGLRCGACGAAISPGAGFCHNCGRAFAVAGSPDTTEYMGFWIRAGAFVIDWVAAYLVAVAVAVAIGFSITSGDADPSTVDDVSLAFESINYSFLLLFWGISVAHSLLMTAWRGQTLGKMIVRIQVVDANGNVPSLQRVLIREGLRAVVLLALFPLGFVYAWVGMDLRKRGPHDHLGRSYVVRKRPGANRRDGGYNQSESTGQGQ